MVCNTRSVVLRILACVCVAWLFAAPLLAQDDPDPNSPSPVLLNGTDPTRVLAVRAAKSSRLGRETNISAFPLNSKINIFVTNVVLGEGEDYRAFRVYAEDSKNRQYRFPVLDLQPVKAKTPTYALTIELRDDVGYWGPISERGDVLVRVSWRGMTTDRLRLGLGSTGGDIKDDPIRYSELLKGSDQSSSGAVYSPDYVGYRWSGDRMRFLEQATFGPTVALDQRIRRLGIRAWIAEQFEAPYPSVNNPYPDMPLKPNTPPADCDGTSPDTPATCSRDTYTMYPMQAWFFKEAYYGEPQLRHRMAWALSQIWVVSGVDTQQSRWLSEYHKILSKNAFGNYRDLIKEMTLNPAMGNYLDMARSTRTNPNENYGREVLQLFSVGLFMLNQDGTLQLDAQNNPIPTYDQNTVNNFTKVLTGWTFCNTACSNSAPGVVNYIDPLVINPNATTLNNQQHDLTAKTLLAYNGSTTSNIAACGNCTTLPNIATYATNSLEQSVDNIFNHPNVGPFIGKTLIQHLVTSDPSPAYVSRVAAAFNNNGLGVRGDMKAVIKAILLDPEARGDVKTDPNFGKLREPVQLWTNVARTLGVTTAAGTGESDGVFYSPTNSLMSGMSQSPFYSPTVFNYYSPDNVIPGTATLGPEFALMTTGTSIARANFANSMVFSRISASQPNVPLGTSLVLTEMQALAAADSSGNQLMDALNQRMMHGTMSAQMRSSILTAVLNIASSNSLARAQQAIYLVMTSSQYQVQR